MPALENSRHEAFARAIVKGMAAGPAYVAAGYAPKGADQNAHALTRNHKVAKRIAELKAEAADGAVMGAREVLERLTVLGRSNMQDYVGAHGQLLNVSQLTREHAAAIQEYTVEQSSDEVMRTKLKLYDKRAALVDLGRHYKLFTDKQELDVGETLEKLIAKSYEGK
jgi:phage terminase small subunit